MSGSGATYEALRKVLSLRQSKCCRLDTKSRPFLVPGADANRYLEKALSGASRKKLRQHRRRLAAKGALETVVVRSPPDVRRAFEDFLALELKGWRAGAAPRC